MLKITEKYSLSDIFLKLSPHLILGLFKMMTDMQKGFFLYKKSATNPL